MAVKLAPLHLKRRTLRFNRSCCFSPRWIIFSILLTCFAQIPGTDTTAKVYINFWTYNNSEILTANSTCCSTELQDSLCDSVCNYTMEICLGSSKSLPCDLFMDNLCFFSLREMPINLTDCVANPVSFGLTKRQDSMSVTIYVNDSTAHRLVDLLHLEFDTPTPATKHIDSTDYTQLNLKGNGLSQPSTMTLSVAVTCDSNYYTDTCEVYCQDSDTCDGHYNCDPVTGSQRCLNGWEGSYCNISQINGSGCSDAAESTEPEIVKEITTNSKDTFSLESMTEPSQDRNDRNTIVPTAAKLTQDALLVTVWSSVHTMMSQLTLSSPSTTGDHISTVLATSIDSTMLSLSSPVIISEEKEFMAGTKLATEVWDLLTPLSTVFEMPSLPTTVPEIRLAADETPSFATSTTPAANETLFSATSIVQVANETLLFGASEKPGTNELQFLATSTTLAGYSSLATSIVLAVNETLFLTASAVPDANEIPSLATSAAADANETPPLTTSIVLASYETPSLASSAVPSENETPSLATSIGPAANDTPFLATSTSVANEALYLATSTVPFAIETQLLATSTVLAANETLFLPTSIITETNETPSLGTSTVSAANETLFLATSIVPPTKETMFLATSTAASETSSVATSTTPAANETLLLATPTVLAANETLFLATSTVPGLNEIPSITTSNLLTANEISVLATSTAVAVTGTLPLATSRVVAVNETLPLATSTVAAVNETLPLATSTVVAVNETLPLSTSTVAAVNETPPLATSTTIDANETLFLATSTVLSVNEILSSVPPSQSVANESPFLATLTASDTNETIYLAASTVLDVNKTTTLAVSSVLAANEAMALFSSSVVEIKSSSLLPMGDLTNMSSFVTAAPDSFGTSVFLTKGTDVTGTVSYVTSTPELVGTTLFITSILKLSGTPLLVTSLSELTATESVITSTPNLVGTASLYALTSFESFVASTQEAPLFIPTRSLASTLAFATSTPRLTDTMTFATSIAGLTDTMAFTTSIPGLTDTMTFATSIPGLTDTMTFATSIPGLTDTMTFATLIAGLTDTMIFATSIPGLTDTMTFATSIAGLTDTMTFATSIPGLTDTMTFATSIAGLTDTTTFATSIPGLADTMTFATSIPGLTDTMTFATSIPGLTDTMTFATSIPGLADTMTFATSIPGLAETMIFATSIPGLAKTMTFATSIPGLAETMTFATSTPGLTNTIQFVTPTADIHGGVSFVTSTEGLIDTISFVTSTPELTDAISFVTSTQVASIFQSIPEITDMLSFLTATMEANKASSSFKSVSTTVEIWVVSSSTLDTLAKSSLVSLNEIWSSLAGSVIDTMSLTSSVARMTEVWDSVLSEIVSTQSNIIVPAATQSLFLTPLMTSTNIWTPVTSGGTFIHTVTELSPLTTTPSVSVSSSFGSLETILPSLTQELGVNGTSSLISEHSTAAQLTLTSIQELTFLSSLAPLPAVYVWSSAGPAETGSTLEPVLTVSVGFSSVPAESLWSPLTQSLNVSLWSSLTPVSIVTAWSSSGHSETLWSSLSPVSIVTAWSSSGYSETLWSSPTPVSIVTAWSSSGYSETLWSSHTPVSIVTAWSSSGHSETLRSSLAPVPTVTPSSRPVESLLLSVTPSHNVTVWSSLTPASDTTTLTSITSVLITTTFISLTTIPDTSTLISLTTEPFAITAWISSTSLSISATFPSDFSNQLTVPPPVISPAMSPPLGSTHTRSLYTSTTETTTAIFSTSTTETSYETMTTTIPDTTTTVTEKPWQIMGELFIARPVAAKDFIALLQIVREALMAASQPALTCCHSVVMDNSALYLDANRNPLLRLEYSFSPPAGSDFANVDRNAMIFQINGQLNMTEVFRVNGNQVYQGTIFGPDVMFDLDIVGDVNMEDYKQIEETLSVAWLKANFACQCQYLIHILHGRRYTGNYGLQLTRVSYTVSRNGLLQSTSSPGKPALEDFVASFNTPSEFFQVYQWTEAVSYDLHFEAALADKASLISPAGVARSQALVTAWTRYLQENGQCMIADCNVTIKYGKPEEHYTNNSNEILNLIYFVTLNNNHINPTSISGPSIQAVGPSMVPCFCQNLPVLSLDLHEYVKYFRVMSVTKDIIGNDSLVIRREYGYDASHNIVTHVIFKPAYFNTIIPKISEKDIESIALKHQVKVKNRRMPFRRRYQLVLEGVVDSFSNEDLANLLQQAWTSNNKDLVTEDLILSIVKVDFEGSVKTDGSPATVVDYTVNVGIFDASLTIVEAPSLSLLQAGLSSRENRTLCDCEIRIKRNITTTGSFTEGKHSLTLLKVPLEEAWKEANEGYTGNITVTVLSAAPREEQVVKQVEEGTTESSRKEEIVFIFIINPSEGQPGVTDLDMFFPEASVINKYFKLHNLDLTVVGEEESPKENMFPWYLPAGIALGVIITGMMIYMFYRILEDQKNAEKMHGSEDPKDFIEDSDNEDLSVPPVAFENIAINNGANSRRYSTRYSISSDYDGQTVL